MYVYTICIYIYIYIYIYIERERRREHKYIIMFPIKYWTNIKVAVFFPMFTMPPCHLTAGTVAKGPPKTGAKGFWVSCWLWMDGKKTYESHKLTITCGFQFLVIVVSFHMICCNGVMTEIQKTWVKQESFIYLTTFLDINFNDFALVPLWVPIPEKTA